MNQERNLISKIEEIRKARGLSNASFTFNELIEMLYDTNYSFDISADYVLIIKKDGDITRLWYYAKDLMSVRQFTLNMPKMNILQDVVCEIVLPDCKVENPIKSIFLNSGWILLQSLRMMICKVNSTSTVSAKTELASIDDASELYKLLFSVFNRKISHLPTMNEILLSIKNSEISVIRLNNKIVSLIIVHSLGKKIRYIFQLCTHPEFRGQGFARNLLQNTINNLEAGLQVQLWVEENNAAAISLYGKMGFVFSERRLEVYSKHGE